MRREAGAFHVVGLRPDFGESGGAGCYAGWLAGGEAIIFLNKINR
jgi:hypothetical protein